VIKFINHCSQFIVGHVLTKFSVTCHRHKTQQLASVYSRDVNKTFFQNKDQGFHTLSDHLVEASYKQCTAKMLSKIELLQGSNITTVNY